jgi:hypothetical protein
MVSGTGTSEDRSMTEETIKTLLLQLPAILMAIAALVLALKGKSDTAKANVIAQTALNKSIEIQKAFGIGEFANDNKLAEFPNDKRGI